MLARLALLVLGGFLVAAEARAQSEASRGFFALPIICESIAALEAAHNMRRSGADPGGAQGERCIRAEAGTAFEVRSTLNTAHASYVRIELYREGVSQGRWWTRRSDVSSYTAAH